MKTAQMKFEEEKHEFQDQRQARQDELKSETAEDFFKVDEICNLSVNSKETDSCLSGRVC